MNYLGSIQLLENNIMYYHMKVHEHRPADLWNGSIILITDDAQCRRELVDLIKGIGGRVPGPMCLNYQTREIEQRLNAVAVIIDIANWDDSVQESFERTAEYCNKSKLPLIALSSMRFLDEAIAASDFDIEILLTDNWLKLPAELIVTLNTLITNRNSGLFSGRDELDLVDLKKISADVDRIARVLSQLSGSYQGSSDRDIIPNPIIEPISDPSVSDAQFNFDAQNASTLLPFGKNNGRAVETDGPLSAEKIRDLIKARRLRDQYFDPELFADPAWDMLLDLMAAKMEGTRVSVSSLCIAAAVPPTTALRWIKTMTEEKVFVRRADENDGRRVFIELSDEAAAGMVGYLSMIHRNGLAAV